MVKKPFSVCLDFLGDAAALREGLAVILPDLNATVSEDGIKLALCEKKGDTLSVVRHGNHATITYGERIHFFRALGLLAQHIDDTEYSVSEKCYFRSNGTMFDVSQSNTLMTVEHVKFLLRRMALMGLNMLMLYNEDNYEIEGWPYFGYMRSRYSAADIREIDDYAFALGIELVPCIQTLAHLVDALKWPCFSGMREDRACLLPDEDRVYEFLENAIVAASKPVRTKRIHIGMDEAMKLGRGHYFDKHGYVNAGEIMLAHLHRVMDILRRHGLKPMLWGDMFFQRIFGKYSYYQQDYGNQKADTVPVTLPNGMKQEADLSYLEQYPKDAQLIAYGYTPDTYEAWDMIINQGKLLGRDPVFAGGIWNWLSFAPNWFYSFNSAIPQLQACKQNGIKEVFATTWGDEAAECPINVVLLGMQLWAELGYSENYEEQRLRERFEFVTGADFDVTMLLEKIDAIPGTLENNVEGFNASKCLLWQDPLFGLLDKELFGLEDKIEEHYRALAPLFRAESEKESDLSREFGLYAKLCDVMEYKATVGCRLKTAYDANDRATLARYANEVLPELLKRQQALYEHHRALFYEQNKPLGFEVFDIRHAITIQRTETARWRLQQYLSGEAEQLLELADDRLYRHAAPSFDTHLSYISLISGRRISYNASATMSDKSGKKRTGEMPIFT